MRLAELQSAVMAQILDDTAQLPALWNERQRAGIDIYRNAYRARLIDTLAEVFQRTREWVGEESFNSAAAHYLITNAPCSWTIDHVGTGFDASLAELFVQDREVAELAWLEWAMHCAFVAADCKALTASDLAAATSSFSDDAWSELRLGLLPGLAMRRIAFDCSGLWRSLARGDARPETLGLGEPRGLVVWREALTPVFTTVDAIELECLERVASGASYGEVCALLVERLGEADAIARAGGLLGRWLANGWIADLGLAGAQVNRSS